MSTLIPTYSSDIDECLVGISGCTQICKNTSGGFTCSCNTGYELSSDNKTCIRKLSILNSRTHVTILITSLQLLILVLQMVGEDLANKSVSMKALVAASLAMLHLGIVVQVLVFITTVIETDCELTCIHCSIYLSIHNISCIHCNILCIMIKSTLNVSNSIFMHLPLYSLYSESGQVTCTHISLCLCNTMVYVANQIAMSLCMYLLPSIYRYQ